MKQLPRLPLVLSLAILLPASILSAFQPGKDQFAQATTISAFSSWTNSFTEAAGPTDITTFTAEQGEKHPGAAGNTAWWRWTPTRSGWATFDTFSTPNNTPPVLPNAVLAVYTGNAVNALTLVTSNADYHGSNQALVSFYATAGVTYYLQLDGGTEVFLGSSVLTMRFFAPEKLRMLGNINTSVGPAAFTLDETVNGMITGKLTVNGATRYFKTTPTTDGWLDVVLPRPAQPDGTMAPPLRLTVNLIPDNSGRYLEAWLEGATPDMAAGYAYRVRTYSTLQPHSVPAISTLAIESSNSTKLGHGYFRSRVTTAGIVSAAGQTGDGRVFTFASATCDASSVVRIPFGAGATGLSGAYQFLGSTASTSGITYCYRKPSTSAYYPAGFHIPFTISGSAYDTNLRNGLVGPRTLTAKATSTYALFTEALQFALPAKFTFSNATRKPVLKLDPLTGIVTGSLVIDSVPHTLRGVLLRDNGTTKIKGYIKGPSQTGVLEVAP